MTTILIVEDEAIVAADLAGKLGRLGYEVAGIAAQGEAAVALACRQRPHLVLMDIWLKGPMDGIEAAEAIRRQFDVPVIYLTAHSDPATLARAKLSGPFGYILKPFEERELATQIELAIYRHQADRQLRLQREWLRVTLTSIGDAVIATDAQGRISFVNPTAESLTGWTSEAAAGQPVQCVFRIVNEQTGQAMEEPVARVLREGRAVELANHTALLTKDGQAVPIEDSAAPILDAAGQVIGAVLVFHDVTEKRRVEDSLREGEAKYRSLFENMLDGFAYCRMIFDEHGHPQDFVYLAVNDAFDRLTGLANVIGKRVTEVIPGIKDLNPELFETYGRVASTGNPERFEINVKPLGLYLSVSVYSPAKGYFVAVFDDISNRKQDEEALKHAKAAAEAANAAKSQFLANMSHELRTPMNAILGMIDVALPKAADPTVQDCLQTARGSADLLLTLLNDLLDSAKIESGKLELEAAPFSLRRMLDQITRVLGVRASEKGLCFYCRVPDETPDAVVGDRMRLQQVLLNLAGNAVKFTEKGEVVMRVENCKLQIENCKLQIQEGTPQCQDPRPKSQDPRPNLQDLRPDANDQFAICNLQFAISDTGIGIPPSALERLFQPFGQADASMSRRFGGTGLGLSICKCLVELMGGTISVESEVGKGSTFYFTVRLPVTKEAPAEFEAPVAIPTRACGQLRVLLVEDNPANQKLAMYILRDRGHDVEIAGDGEEAIYLAMHHRYDVILMDVQMPGKNGLEATEAIRKREAPENRVPIIAMTAHALKDDRDRCLAAGMDGYLSKPVNAKEMIGLVEGLARVAIPRAALAVSARCSVESSSQAIAVFDPGEALSSCCGSRDMVREMIQCFFDEVENLLPKMRRALEKGDLEEVGRLGHRMKGTVVYLGAEPAKEAARRVERFCKSSGGTPAEAGEAVNSLEYACRLLKAALREHPLAVEPK